MRNTLIVLLSLSTLGAGEEAGTRAERPILLTLVVHLDPICGRSPDGKGIEERYQEERENLRWLFETVMTLRKGGEEQAPRVLLEFGGDHAEYYRQDPDGLDLLRKAVGSGLFALGVHFHDQYRDEDGTWRVVRRRPQENPQEGRAEWAARVTRDNIESVDAMVGAILGTEDREEIREACYVITGHFLDEAVSTEAGFTLRTGGANETLNLFFDCDVYHPYRPGRGSLKEDLRGPRVLIPQMPPVGVIGEHAPIPRDVSPDLSEGMDWGIWQDLSLPAVQRKLLHAYLEWLLDDGGKVFTTGWTIHTNNLYPGDGEAGDKRQLRDELTELLRWLNGRLVGQRSPSGRLIARYAHVHEVRDAYLAWEKETPNRSSFTYPYPDVRWEACPYRLTGVVRELMYSHAVEELDLGKGVHTWRLERAEGRGWEYARGDLVCRSATQTVLLLWAEEAVTVDASRWVESTAIEIDGVNGKGREVDASAVEVDTKPIVLIPSR